MDGKGFPKWKVTVDVNEGDKLEYKYCIVGSDGGIARWETKGSSVNRKCKVMCVCVFYECVRWIHG